MHADPPTKPRTIMVIKLNRFNSNQNERRNVPMMKDKAAPIPHFTFRSQPDLMGSSLLFKENKNKNEIIKARERVKKKREKRTNMKRIIYGIQQWNWTLPQRKMKNK